MASHDEVIARWLDVLEGRTGRNGRALENYSSSSSNVFARGAVLFSYGSHFHLAEYLERGSSGRRRGLFLLNGDRVSSSTSRHQSAARQVISSRADGFGADVLIVPFSALDAARVIRETIRPLEVRPDRFKTEYRDVPSCLQLDDVDTADERDERETEHATATTWTWRDGTDRYSRVHVTRRYDYGTSRAVDVDEWRGYLNGNHTLERDERGAWRVALQRHFLGDSVFLANVDEGWRDVPRPWTVADVVRAAVRSITARRERPDGFLDVVDTLENVGAAMAEGPIVESVPYRPRRRFVSAFDSNEPRPLYFLATLPRTSTARTVDGALEDLAPYSVHAALARGRQVLRQGDIFAIATDLTDEDVYGMARTRARLTSWTVGARPRRGEHGFGAPLNAAERRAFSAYRAQVWRDLFAAEQRRYSDRPLVLRGARAKYRAAAEQRHAALERYRLQARSLVLRGNLADLVPRSYYHGSPLEDVRLRFRHVAERRQDPSRTVSADVYRGRRGAALECWRAAHTAALERFCPLESPLGSARLEWREQVRDIVSLFGTSHAATETVRAAGGAVYVRGTLRHVPDLERGRRGGRDHVPLKLGDGRTWHLAVRNTVPRLRDARRP